MKFDNFVKYAGSDGVILTASDNSKWLGFGSVLMKVPEGKNVCGKVANMPEYMEDLIFNNSYSACELTDAFVPRCDSKPSELRRVFSGSGRDINISNKAFGFIEKKDRTYVSSQVVYEEEVTTTYTALLITDDYGEDDDLEFKMVVIEREVDR